MGVDDRVHWIEQDRWINYVRAERILDRLSQLLSYPPRARMPSLLLFAEPAMGKTHILEKFLRDHRSGAELGCSARVPIACVQMPPYPHERDFYQEVLTALGTVVPDGMSVVTLRHRVRVLARQLQLRMLVIDEIHGMLQGSDNLSHEWMMKFIEHRVADRRILRLIRKWLKAGVSEDGQWSETKLGTPQGAVASPLIANVYPALPFRSVG